MSRYELMFVISPKVKEADMRPAADQVQKMVTTGGGKIVEELDWGKKKLAYPIKNYRHGFYYVLFFDSEPEVIQKLGNNLKQNDDLLRYLLIKLDAPAVRAIAAQKKRALEHPAEAEAETTASTRPAAKVAAAKSAPAMITPEKPTLPPVTAAVPSQLPTDQTTPAKPATRSVVATPVPTAPAKPETAVSQEKREKAKLDELDKKLDEILDEDITD